MVQNGHAKGQGVQSILARKVEDKYANLQSYTECALNLRTVIWFIESTSLKTFEARNR